SGLALARVTVARGRARPPSEAPRRARSLQAAARPRQASGFHSARGALYARRGRSDAHGGRVSIPELTEEGGMRTWWAAAVVAIGVGVFAMSATGSDSKSGGTFRLGTASRIDSLNPYVAFNQDAYNTFEYIYPFLVQYDRTNRSF